MPKKSQPNPQEAGNPPDGQRDQGDLESEGPDASAEPSPPQPGTPKGGDANPAAILHEETWRTAQLAVQMMAMWPPREDSRTGRAYDPGDPQWNDYFERTVQLTELLLKSCHDRDEDIHAYQVFREGTVMTEEQIRAEFKAAGWDGLKSKPPVMNLMREAREFFSDEEYALMDRYPLVDATNQTKAWDLIGKALKELSSNPNVAAAYPGFTEAASRFTENLNEPRSMGWDVRPQSEAIEMSFWLRTFSDWCFPKSDSKAQHVYRPHEIFRYAARNGWKPSLLIRSRSALAKGFLPFPERATSSGWRFEDFPVFFEQRGDTAWNQEFGSSSGSEPADGGEAARSGSES